MLTEFTQVENSGQILTFFLAVLFGGILCLVYDTYRCILITLSAPKWLQHSMDIVYFLFCAIVCFCFLLVECKGEIRFYAVLGFVVGFFSLRKLLSRYVRALLRKIITFFTKWMGLLFKPLRKGFRLCYCRILPIYQKVAKSLQLFSKKKEKPLANDSSVDV